MKNILKYGSVGAFSAIAFIGCTAQGKLSEKQIKALDTITSLKTANQEQNKALEDLMKGINWKALVEKKLCASGDKKNDQECIKKYSAHFSNPKDREMLNKKILEDLRTANTEDGVAAKEIINPAKELLLKSNEKNLSNKTLIGKSAEDLQKCVVNNFKYTVVQKVEPVPVPAPLPTEARPEGAAPGSAPEAPKEPVVITPPAPSIPLSKSCFASATNPAGEIYWGDEKPPVVEQPKPTEGVKVEEHK